MVCGVVLIYAWSAARGHKCDGWRVSARAMSICCWWVYVGLLLFVRLAGVLRTHGWERAGAAACLRPCGPAPGKGRSACAARPDSARGVRNDRACACGNTVQAPLQRIQGPQQPGRFYRHGMGAPVASAPVVAIDGEMAYIVLEPRFHPAGSVAG
jgi:hypothetical protein